MGINFGELFPTRKSILIFIFYMSLFVAQGILVTASQKGSNNGYSYDIVTVVLLTEVLKLVVSCVLYCREHTIHSLIINTLKGSKVLLLYFIPAFLYCLYNNLAFVNLSKFDPTTYYLLLQFRVVITGILFQIIFKRYLSRKQWLSLCVLTIGCMVKQVNFGDIPVHVEMSNSHHNETNTNDSFNLHNKNMSGFDLSINAVFIFIQMICSCLAGVYNEYLLKNQGSDINIYIQNVYMYVDSIICNALILLFRGEFFSAFSSYNLSSIFKFNVIIIMVNNCAIGIVTSFFLKYLNSILKTFASALELMFTAILSMFLFSIPVYINTILSILIVSAAVFIYSQHPVVNLSKNFVIKETTEDKKALLDDDDSSTDLQMEHVIVK